MKVNKPPNSKISFLRQTDLEDFQFITDLCLVTWQSFCYYGAAFDRF